MLTNKIIDAEQAKMAYALWLYDLIDPMRKRSFCKDFIELLFSFTFVSRLPNDANREADGKKLREIFVFEKPDFAGCLPDEACSILEMLIGVAIRIDNNLSDERSGNRTDEWFWMLIRNLELDVPRTNKFTKNEIEAKMIANRFKLDVLVERRYQRDGSGGLFPLRNPKKDQRHVEIWYQMMAYLDENFGY